MASGTDPVQTLRHVRLESARLQAKALELYEADLLSDWLESLCDALGDAFYYANGAVKELEDETGIHQ